MLLSNIGNADIRAGEIAEKGTVTLESCEAAVLLLKYENTIKKHLVILENILYNEDACYCRNDEAAAYAAAFVSWVTVADCMGKR